MIYIKSNFGMKLIKSMGVFEGCKIEWDDLIEWITENKLKVAELIQHIISLS